MRISLSDVLRLASDELTVSDELKAARPDSIGVKAVGSRLNAISVAILALLTGGVALVFQLWPQLKPDPRETLGAQAKIVALDRGVTYDEFLHRVYFTQASYAAQKARTLKEWSGSDNPGVEQKFRGLLSIKGAVVYVSVAVEGFKNRHATVTRAVYDGRSDTRLDLSGFNGNAAARLTLEAPTDRFVLPVWIPPPPGRGPFFVRIEIYARPGVLLTIADSPLFKNAA